MTATPAGEPLSEQALSFEASCIALGDAGVMLMGAPGVGKSDLALRLIDRGAMLVSDSRVILHRQGEELIANAPPALINRLAIYGLPEIQLPTMQEVPIRLAVAVAQEPASLPSSFDCLGLQIPVIAINPGDVSADVKIRATVWNLNMQEGS